MRFLLLPGQRHDSVGVAPLISGLKFDALIADKAFDSNALQTELNDRGALAVIPPNRSHAVPGRPGAQMILSAIRKHCPWIKLLFAGSAYDRGKPMDNALTSTS